MFLRPLAALLLLASALTLGGCDRCGHWDFSVCKKVDLR
jgi:hypothetical protein